MSGLEEHCLADNVPDDVWLLPLDPDLPGWRECKLIRAPLDIPMIVVRST
jgi:hypothetical protein